MKLPRPKLVDILVAAAAPMMAYDCFPSWSFFPRLTPLRRWLSGTVLSPRAWEIGCTGCMGQPVGEPDLVWAELVFRLAEDFTVFAIAMMAVVVLDLALVGLWRWRKRRMKLAFPSWSLLLALASVTAWAWGTLLALRAV